MRKYLILAGFLLLCGLPAHAVGCSATSIGQNWTCGASAESFAYGANAVMTLTPDHQPSFIVCGGTGTSLGNTIADTGSHTWHNIRSVSGAGYGEMDLWYTPNTSISAITITITATIAAGQCVNLWSSISGTITFDNSCQAVPTSGTAIGCSLVTSHVAEVLFAWPIPSAGQSTSVNTGTGVSATASSGAYITKATSGTYTDPSFTASSTIISSAGMINASFYVVASGGSSVQRRR